IFGEGEVSTGASNDFERATALAHSMITEYGMSEKIGPLQFTSGGGEVFLGRDLQNEQNYSDAIAHEIDKEMQHFITYCYDRAKTILTENKDKLELIAKTLLEVETLDAQQIKSLFYEGVLPPEDTRETAEAEDEGTSSEGEDEDVKVNISKKEDEPKVSSYEEAKEKKFDQENKRKQEEQNHSEDETDKEE